MTKKILLLDVSHLFFRAFFAIPRGLTDTHSNPINAVFGVCSMILSLLESEKPDYIFGAKDEKGPTKRHEVMPEYKGHRPEMPSELVAQLTRIFEIFEAFQIPLFSEPGFEADDFLATLAEKYRGNTDFIVEIVTGDHDAFQLVGENVIIGLPQNGGKPPLHLNREGIFQKMGVYPEQIADYKAMVGDPSDNLKGVDGIGEKTAVKLLSEFTTLENILEHAADIPGKIGEKLQTGREIARQTKEMTTLHRDLELKNFDLESGCVARIPETTVEQFFRNLNFHSLINRMPKAFGHANAAVAAEEDAWAELEAAKEQKLSVKSVEKEEGTEPQMSLF